jgi:hypothetical protein
MHVVEVLVGILVLKFHQTHENIINDNESTKIKNIND